MINVTGGQDPVIRKGRTSNECITKRYLAHLAQFDRLIQHRFITWEYRSCSKEGLEY
jgi:hypothetical protein